MIEQLKQYLENIPQSRRANELREYLQWLILKIIDNRKYRKSLVFTGGTSLRIVYQNKRFSEDLDFSQVGRTKLEFQNSMETILSDLARYGLKVNIFKLKHEKTVKSCFFRFEELLWQLGLSNSQEQKLSIKLEIDSNAPRGGNVQEYIFNGPILFSLNHYDLPGLFACKLHAMFFRKYLKGRDYYDLLFFLRKKCNFNFQLFKNAVKQTNPGEKFRSVSQVIQRLNGTVEDMNEKTVINDLKPFLFDPSEIEYVKKKYLLGLLRQNSDYEVYTEGA